MEELTILGNGWLGRVEVGTIFHSHWCGDGGNSDGCATVERKVCWLQQMRDQSRRLAYLAKLLKAADCGLMHSGMRLDIR